MKNETVVIYVDVMERCRFFTKFYGPLQELGYDIWFITARLSVARQIERLTTNITVLKESPGSEPSEQPLDYQNSLSVLNAYHTLKQAQQIGSSVYKQLNELSKARNITMFWVWNGTSTVAMTVTSFAQQHNIATRYFEISNLSKRIFVDTEGTSGASYLCQHPSILDPYPANEEQYREWLETYRQEDLAPKQAANRSKIPWHALIDAVGYMRGYIREDRRSFSKLLYNRLANQFFTHSFAQADLHAPYVFLPLQVSDDSQLKLFSSYSNIDMLNKALHLSREKGIRLIVKIHPAESNRDQIEQIRKFSQLESFVIAENPTKSLIKKAQLIIVNNSTVGLQALIEEKEVLVFGNALYREFDQARLKTYILNYLLNADYFGDDPIPLTTVQSIIQRDLWQPKEQGDLQ